MNTLYLNPSDVLFFRDGRPMSGSLSGYGAAWPLPTVINAALHAALHRAEIGGEHTHLHKKNKIDKEGRVRKFGSLITAGPFPVRRKNINADEGIFEWLFPRPLDAGCVNSAGVTLLPLAAVGEQSDFDWSSNSSLPQPLKYAVANTQKPSKKTPSNWWTQAAWRDYLNGRNTVQDIANHEFSDTEITYGIGIDEATGARDGERFYSAHYLRLRDTWRLGLFAKAEDKIDCNVDNKRDLIEIAFPNSGAQTAVIVGGQQRVCSVERSCDRTIPLPVGKNEGFFDEKSQKYLIKWVLLSPAVFPAISDKDKDGNPMTPHSGGWLPSWIAEKNQTFEGEHVKAGSVLLLDGPGKEKAKRKKLEPGKRILATLVAAMIGKSIPITGYALLNKDDSTREPGAKSPHLAVPAGSVYYFECESAEAAQALANTLNWHGKLSDNELPTQIINRRSALFGEKGFGLGVCAGWTFHDGELPSTPA